MNYRPFSLFLAAAFLLAGCSSAKEQLGLDRSAPDEFAVVKRAPLSMPPDYNLRPPRPGAPRPQEQATSEQAREAVMGQQAAPAQGQTAAESALLQEAGASTADPAIRSKVDAETAGMADRNKTVAQKVLGIGGDPDTASATVVDPAKEAERLKKNKEEGKPVTEGETPTLEQ